MYSDESLTDKILLIIAYCGESTIESLSRLSDSHSYFIKIINELTRAKYLKKNIMNEKKCIRITNRGKKRLTELNKERFYIIFQNMKIKSEIRKRIRLHRLADILISMFNANIEIFIDNKFKIFGSENKAKFKVPAFYTPMEIRQIGDKNFSNSKFFGILFSMNEIFFTYHVSDGYIKWFQMSENKMFVNIEQYINNSKLKNIYINKRYSSIFFGNKLDVVSVLIIERSNTIINKAVHALYFITLDSIGDKMLRILCNPELKSKIDNIFFDTFKKTKPDYSIECDGMLDDKPVIVSYIFELTRLSRFIYALKYHKKEGIIICFDFQKEVIGKIVKTLNLSANIEIRTIVYNKFERSFL